MRRRGGLRRIAWRRRLSALLRVTLRWLSPLLPSLGRRIAVAP